MPRTVVNLPACLNNHCVEQWLVFLSVRRLLELNSLFLHSLCDWMAALKLGLGDVGSIPTSYTGGMAYLYFSNLFKFTLIL